MQFCCIVCSCVFLWVSVAIDYLQNVSGISSFCSIVCSCVFLWVHVAINYLQNVSGLTHPRIELTLQSFTWCMFLWQLTIAECVRIELILQSCCAARGFILCVFLWQSTAECVWIELIS